MKRLVNLMLIFVLATSLFAEVSELPDKNELSGKEKITVSKIRVYLDDVELTEELDGNTSVSLSTVLSFTKLKAGKKISLAALDYECTQTKYRLLESGLFYSAAVEVVPPRKNPEKRTIIISVTTGFLGRFGGGPIYGVIGKAAVGGNRNLLLGLIGWNVNGVKYLDENSFGVPLILGSTVTTDVPACFTKENKSVNFDGRFTAGYFITPDLSISVDTILNLNTKEGFGKELFVVSPSIYSKHYLSSKIYTTFEMRGVYRPVVSSKDFNGELCGTVNYSPFQRLNVAALVSGGCRFGNNSEFDQIFAHDLFINHSSVSENAALSKRALRSGYSADELIYKDYVLTSLEARWKAFDFTILNTFPCVIRPFVFTDLVYGQNISAEENAWKFKDAYGVGIQLNFDSPVFAYFNFSYGWNHLGKGKFCFYTGLSF